MRLVVIGLLTLSGLLGSAVTVAQTTRPAEKRDDGALVVRATQAFNRGEYAIALPLLKKLRREVEGQGKPERLGPIDERIRVCEKNLANDDAAAAAGDDPQAAATDRPQAEGDGPLKAEPPPTSEQRKAHAAPKDGQVLELTIKDLGNFDYDNENGGHVPADVKRLNGVTVRINGFMVPMDQAENITQFALVPDLFACCFGQPPQVQHTLVVNCPAGKAVSYFPDEIVVEGKLTVEEKKDEGYIVSLFEVEAASVKPAPK